MKFGFRAAAHRWIQHLLCDYRVRWWVGWWVGIDYRGLVGRISWLRGPSGMAFVRGVDFYRRGLQADLRMLGWVTRSLS